MSRYFSLVALTMLLLVRSSTVSAQARVGDFIVVDENAFGGSGGVISVDPVTGAQTRISSGGFFVDPIGVAVDRQGQIIVVDQNAIDGNGAVIRVNPATGVQTVLSWGGYFANPTGVTVDANGDIIVADRGPGSYFGTGLIIRVNPTSGVQTLITTGGALWDPNGVAVDANGDIFVADNNCCGGAYGIGGGVIKVDHTSGAQLVVSSEGSFLDPFGIAVAGQRVFVADPSAFALSGGVGAIFQVDPSGVQTLVSTGGRFVRPSGVQVNRDGRLIVADYGDFNALNLIDSTGAIFSVDPVTGRQTTVSAGGMFVDPIGIVIFPRIASADLGIVSVATPDPARTGSELTFTITVTNYSKPDDAENVVLTDTLPADVTFLNASAQQGTCSETAGIVTCPLGDVDYGSSTIITIVVVVNRGTSDTLLNTASVVSETFDPNLTNNVDAQKTLAEPGRPSDPGRPDSPGKPPGTPGRH